MQTRDARTGDRGDGAESPRPALDPARRRALSYAAQYGSLADPGGPGALAAAVQWLQGIMLGTAATSVAAICVAAVGLTMLTGRLDLRGAARVIAGCFILFGASGIAAGIGALAGLAGPGAVEAEAGAPPSPLAELALEPRPPPPAPASQADPYAGAAVPR